MSAAVYMRAGELEAGDYVVGSAQTVIDAGLPRRDGRATRIPLRLLTRRGTIRVTEWNVQTRVPVIRPTKKGTP